MYVSKGFYSKVRKKLVMAPPYNLAAARQLLKGSLEKSRDIASALRETGPRLEKSSQRLSSLEETMKNAACRCALYDVRRRIDRALGPAAAVLKIFDVVRDLQKSFPADPASDLQGYLAAIQRIQEAARLLTENCKLVILWLEDALQFLEDHAVGDHDWYITSVTKCLKILGQLQATEQHLSLQGGLLTEAFDRLEDEFRRLLSIISFPPPQASSFLSTEELSIISPTSFPQFGAENMHMIIERLSVSNRLQECLSIYAEVRSSIVRTALEAQDLNYLEISLSQFDSVQNVEGYIDQWDEHLQFAVRHLFEMEYRLCGAIFQKAGCDVWMGCFADIVLQSGFYNFIKFGNTVTRGKKEAIKLLKLLDVFAALNRLRPDFNRLFSGKACAAIQGQTRDLIKKVIDGACEIFWELPIQVESQRSSGPPGDGCLSRLLLFVTEFCNLLLEDEYRSILVQVLEIHQGWNNREFQGGLVPDQIHIIIEALELNLQGCAKTYDDTTLSSLFLLNNSWYLCNNIRGTKLGDLMGHDWLRGYEESAEYYAAVYLRESWGRLLAFLSEEDLTFFPGGRAIDRELVRKRLQEFHEAFQDTYRKQSDWVFTHKGLRLRMFQLVVQVIVPPYKSYVQKYASAVEDDENESDNHESPKFISLESLEKMISSLFQHKLGKCGSAKCTPFAGELNNVGMVPTHIRSTPAAA